MQRTASMLARALATALAIAGFAAAQDRPAAGEVIGEIKEFERSHGLPQTGNFQRQTSKEAASYRCYFTGKLELPASYDELQLRQGNGSGCPVDPQKYDVFYYPAEAVASGNAPVTSSLASATVERQLVVVPHEDVHSATELEKLGTEMSEAAATLIGFGAAAEFARQRFGAASAEYRNLSREAGLFLAKSKIVNRYWEELRALYAGVRSGQTSPRDALFTKEQTFSRLRQECRAIQPRPVSFDPCPAANNNAGLAFDATYTRDYPLLYELYSVQGQDFRRTLDTLREIGRGSRRGDPKPAERVRAEIERVRTMLQSPGAMR